MRKFSEQYFNEDPDKNTIHENWNKLKSKIHDLREKYVPSKMSSTRHNLPYITRAIKRIFKKKQRQYNKAKNTQAQKDWSVFRNIRSKVQKLLREARSDFINNKLGPSIKEKPKAFFRYISNLRQDTTGIQQLSDDKSALKSSSQEKADILNKQFQSVFTTEPAESAMPNILPSQFLPMENIQIHIPGVEKLLRNIDPSKATGPAADGIQAIILKETATEISAVLTHIFTQSISSGILPHDWKEANISPVLKKGDKTKPENYRPISLTSIACKILEHIVVSSMMKHLDDHNILSSCQHGFRRNHSCETQLILTSQDIARAYTRKKTNGHDITGLQ